MIVEVRPCRNSRPGSMRRDPDPARTYDYFLGGKDNFAADREVAEKVIESWPAIRVGVRENKKFLARVVRYLAGEVGIRQFLDIGTGLPTAENVHEAAQAVAPSAHVVYVDNDRASWVVCTHSELFLPRMNTGEEEFRVSVISGRAPLASSSRYRNAIRWRVAKRGVAKIRLLLPELR